MTIGLRLRGFLRFHEWSIGKLAAETGIPYSTLLLYLSDRRKPGANQLAAMRRAGIDLNWLLSEEPPPARDAYDNGFTDCSEVVGKSPELLAALGNKARQTLHNINWEIIRSGGRPISPERSFYVFMKIYKAFLFMATKKEKEVIRLQKVKFPADQIADNIIGSLSQDIIVDPSLFGIDAGDDRASANGA